MLTQVQSIGIQNLVVETWTWRKGVSSEVNLVIVVKIYEAYLLLISLLNQRDIDNRKRSINKQMTASLTGSAENKPRPGSPSKLTSRAKRMIVRSVTSKPMTSAQNIANELLSSCNVSVSAQTVRNVLHSAGLKERNLMLGKQEKTSRVFHEVQK
ncbi:hypothetical protein TNCV_3495661 [Trichonephila clavipes]|nr:hypothetical protein TNCV_3495661 [Trichonephila clavipes]